MTTAAAAAIPAGIVLPKLAAYNVIEAHYKVVQGVPIPASVFIPKDIPPGRHPVHVRWHGGCFITGHRALPDWFGAWLLDFSLAHNAILISPDYRLMPESSGLDILDDLRDFYTWLSTPANLASLLPAGVQPDVDHLLVTGESAGGWLALQSALLPASRPRISAVISQYPMIDLRDKYYTTAYEKQLFAPTAPQLDPSVFRAYVDSMTPGAVITSALPPDRFQLVVSILQQGLFGKYFGPDRRLYPMEALDSLTDGEELPPTWVMHGTADTGIPVEGTYRYEKRLKERLPRAKTLFHYEEGADHGFDNAEGVGLQTDWVKKGVKFVEQYWPQH